jgi:hypothetical protein
VREHIFLAPARRVFQNAGAQEQQEFDRIIDEICSNPWVDPPLKDEFDVPPVVIFRYHDGSRWVVYDLPDDATVRIWMVGVAPEAPTPR